MNAQQNQLAVVCQSLVHPEMQAKFKQVLPADVSLDRFTRVTLTAIQKNPAILDCDRTSFYNSCLDAANRGLMPDGKEGAIVAFRQKEGPSKAQFMPMPEGIIKELAKAGVAAHAISVYEKDQVEIWNDDDGQHFKHVPKVFGDRGERIGAVAWAKAANGRTYVEAMNMDDLLRVAQVSRSKDRNGNIVGPWAQWPERMEQKSALHRLRKRIPIVGHEDVVARLQEDEEAIGADLPVADANVPVEPEAARAAAPTAQKPRPKGLQAALDAAKQQSDDPGPGDYEPAGDDEREMF